MLITSARRTEVLILSPEPSHPEEGPLRATRLAHDGPIGHEVGTKAKLVERLSDFDDVRPLTDAEVIAWTSTAEYVMGSKAVAFVQADNEIRFVASRAGRYAEASAVLEEARAIFRSDPDAATTMLQQKIAEIMEIAR